VGILEDKGVPQPHGLAVDLEDPVSIRILDPEVVSDREDLLAHLERRSVEPVVPQPHRTPHRH